MSEESRGFDPDAAAQHDGVYGLPHTETEAGVVLVPVPWEATVSYRAGTANGPAAILEASRQVDLTDRETGRPYEAGIAMLPISSEGRAWSDEARTAAEAVIAAGGLDAVPMTELARLDLETRVRKVDELGERMNAWVEAEVDARLAAGKLVGVIGGDHASPFGAIRATARRFPGLGILHLDAHCDLRVAYEGFRWSHASIFDNVLREIPEVTKLVQIGVRDFGQRELDAIEAARGRIHCFFDSDLRRRLHDGEAWSAVLQPVIGHLPRLVYLSFDIDGLDPVLCPHTGTPVPGGLSFAEVSTLLRLLVESGRRIVGFDLCEVAPDPSGASEWDGNVAARLLYKMIGYALRSRG
ncbi:MAG: agmatinase family protein [Candidatus Eisenbacteria bacterium]